MAAMQQTFEIDTFVGAVEQVVKGQRTPYQIVLSGGVDKFTGTPVEAGEFIDWRKTVGPKAMALQGTEASARVKVKYVPREDGDGYWQNLEIHDIAPLGALPPQGQPIPGGTMAQPMQPQMAPQIQQQPMQQPAMQPQGQPIPQPQPQMPQQAPQQAAPAPSPVAEMMGLQRDSEASRTRQGAVRAACEYVAAQCQAGMFEGATDADAALKARIEDLTSYVVTGSFPGDEKATTPQQVADQVEGVQVGVPFDTNEGEQA